MEKERVSKRKEKKDKSNYSIKIVVRHLPPTMTEHEFLEQVEPLPENDYYYYCNADWSLGQDATCRAYIDMSLKDVAEVLQFRDRFDGYVFVDSKGGEYVAIVEYAPFQSFMKNKARNKDNKVNTIEKESHFQEFVRKLNEEREESNRLGDLKFDYNFDHRSDEVKSTPLLQYLANKKEKRREEARRRNEEKRKQREEQKLAQRETSESSKTKQTNIEIKKANNNSKTELKEGQRSEELAKNSRSKRRTERDQRRREQHEQRKITRDRESRDKKNEGYENKEVKDLKCKKERNQSDNEKHMKKEIIILTKDKEMNFLPMPINDTIKLNDSYKEMDISRCKEVSGSANTSLKPNNQSSQENCVLPSACKVKNLRSSEENRIRNKDRPARAIYQPKVRKSAAPEEIEQNATTNSTCATETNGGSESNAPLTDEKTKNKRLGRRNKQKPQDNAVNIRISKSSESSTSAHSTITK